MCRAIPLVFALFAQAPAAGADERNDGDTTVRINARIQRSKYLAL